MTMGRATLHAFAAAGVVVALLATLVAANDFFVRVQVLDCSLNPKAGAYVSLYGCTDASDGTGNPATTAQTSSVIQAVSTTLGGYAGTTIPTVQQDPKMYCPYTDTTLGLKADYCSSSGNSRDCSLAVMKYDATKSPPYVLDTDYTPKTNLYGQYLLDYVRNTLDGTTKLYPGVDCPSQNAYCSSLVYSFAPNNCARPPTCPACPVDATNNPKGVQIQQVSGETGYLYTCAKYSADPNTFPPTGFPSFISFRKNQKLFASDNPLVISGNNWGWMGMWPATYLSTDNGATCFVPGYIWAGQDTPAGTVKTWLTSPAPGAFKLNFAIDLTPNKLASVHVYFDCTPLTTSAPGQFGNTFELSPAVARYSGSASASGCTGNYLYMAIHVSIA